MSNNLYIKTFQKQFGTVAGACINECAATRRNKHPQQTDQTQQKQTVATPKKQGGG